MHARCQRRSDLGHRAGGIGAHPLHLGEIDVALQRVRQAAALLDAVICIYPVRRAVVDSLGPGPGLARSGTPARGDRAPAGARRWLDDLARTDSVRSFAITSPQVAKMSACRRQRSHNLCESASPASGDAATCCTSGIVRSTAPTKRSGERGGRRLPPAQSRILAQPGAQIINQRAVLGAVATSASRAAIRGAPPCRHT